MNSKEAIEFSRELDQLLVDLRENDDCDSLKFIMMKTNNLLYEMIFEFITDNDKVEDILDEVYLNFIDNLDNINIERSSTFYELIKICKRLIGI